MYTIQTQYYSTGCLLQMWCIMYTRYTHYTNTVLLDWVLVPDVMWCIMYTMLQYRHYYCTLCILYTVLMCRYSSTVLTRCSTDVVQYVYYTSVAKLLLIWAFVHYMDMMHCAVVQTQCKYSIEYNTFQCQVYILLYTVNFTHTV